jgi:hypothetical protein
VPSGAKNQEREEREEVVEGEASGFDFNLKNYFLVYITSTEI